MNDLNKIAEELRSRLFDQQEIVKQAQAREAAVLQKMASVQEDNRILNETLTMVSKGQIDPEDVVETLDQFRRDPQQIEVVKEAFKLGLDRVPSIGSPSEEQGVTPAKKSAEDEFAETLSEVESSLRKSW